MRLDEHVRFYRFRFAVPSQLPNILEKGLQRNRRHLMRLQHGRSGIFPYRRTDDRWVVGVCHPPIAEGPLTHRSAGDDHGIPVQRVADDSAECAADADTLAFQGLDKILRIITEDAGHLVARVVVMRRRQDVPQGVLVNLLGDFAVINEAS